jgi:hypothetical protein
METEMVFDVVPELVPSSLPSATGEKSRRRKQDDRLNYRVVDLKGERDR